ncbi:hypothetical protein O6P43_028550 [Quillaja saponaria]|uniref:Uncharacterized protein n=1 Tax=Quillaja saponaria TaxID=32244 RepID=A0AAD7KYC7_QUISA|nr:hypothetical protein O6P43_028550 [Quillaja saponaria]
MIGGFGDGGCVEALYIGGKGRSLDGGEGVEALHSRGEGRGNVGAGEYEHGALLWLGVVCSSECSLEVDLYGEIGSLCIVEFEDLDGGGGGGLAMWNGEGGGGWM